MLISLVGSYWPVEDETVRPAPTMNERFRSWANSVGERAGLPRRLMEKFTRVSARPERRTLRLCCNTAPLMFPQTYGNRAVSSPCRPNKPNVRPYPAVGMLRFALTLDIGRVGSNRTDPVEYPNPSTRKFNPTGDAEYARGSRSCASTGIARIGTKTQIKRARLTSLKV